MSNIVGVHVQVLASADDDREDGRRASLPEGDRRNRRRVDEGDRRFRACSGCRISPPRQKDWYALIVYMWCHCILSDFV